MCSVSAIGDNYRDNFKDRWPGVVNPDWYRGTISARYVTEQEFAVLKKEVEELKTLLMAAKKFDEETRQPHCEMDEKVAFIKKIAEFVGVDVSEVFK